MTYIYYCDRCGAHIEVVATGRNAAIRVACSGQVHEHDRVHEPTQCRQIGGKL